MHSAGSGYPPGRMLRVAAAAQAAEAAGLCVAVVLNVIDSVSGRAWTTSNAMAFIAVEVIVAAGVAAIASGIARVRPWSRTPAVMTQVFTVMIAIWLLEAHRYGWGFPTLLLAVAGLAGLFAPASLRALTRGASPDGDPPGPRTGPSPPAAGSPAKAARDKAARDKGTASPTPLFADVIRRP